MPYFLQLPTLQVKHNLHFRSISRVQSGKPLLKYQNSAPRRHPIILHSHTPDAAICMVWNIEKVPFDHDRPSKSTREASDFLSSRQDLGTLMPNSAANCFASNSSGRPATRRDSAHLGIRESIMSTDRRRAVALRSPRRSAPLVSLQPHRAHAQREHPLEPTRSRRRLFLLCDLRQTRLKSNR